MQAGLIVHAVARHLNFHQGLLVPEAVVDCTAVGSIYYGFGKCYLADLMWVTRDNYATEIEIKTTRSDWRVDGAKDKWRHLPGWVTRFIYAVPEALGIPEWVHPKAGVWHVNEGGRILCVKAPKRMGKDKVPEWIRDKWGSHLYSRYWEQHLRHAPKLRTRNEEDRVK
jgi:hypothetical protein